MLEARHITFSWGGKALLDDVSFAVAPGETVALTGCNGAGKTSLLRVLAGLCVPVKGTVLADGSDVFDEPMKYRRRLGFLPENPQPDGDLTVKQYLHYRARLKGEVTKKIRHRVLEAIDLCNLASVADTRIERLSQGQRKRAALADAILLRPRFLLLDDLLAGLDAGTRASIGRILAAVSTFAATVVTGHELDELQQWAASFLVLKDGRVLGAKTAAGARTILTEVPGRTTEKRSVAS